MLNEILGVAARFNQHLTRRFGVTGGAPSPQLTPEVAPVFALEHGPGSHVLQSEYLSSGVLLVNAVAAKKSAAGLFNPAGSNVILEVSQIEGSCGTAGAMYAGVVKTTPYSILPAAGGVTHRETRVPLDPGGSTATRPPTGVIRADNDPPTLPIPNVFARLILASTPAVYNEPIVLAPGWAVVIYLGTVNLGLYAAFSWTETPLAHGEIGPF